MHVLITGGCGFVGRHFCRRFVDKGYKVTCVDNLISNSALDIDKWPEHLACDVTFIKADCVEFFKTTTTVYDLVIHLAAIVGGRCVIENNPLLVANDLCIDAEFFKWVITTHPRKVVYFSSSAAYPISLQEDAGYYLKESDLQIDNLRGVPDLTYGWCKLTGEFLAKIAHDKHGIDIVCYRPFSGYGEDQHETYPFIGILERIVRKENPIEIWSDAYRDFVYIDDIVDCILITMNQVHDGKGINICSGRAVSFVELAKTMMDVCGHSAEIKIIDDKPKGVNFRAGDPTYVNSLDWKPRTSLEQGIAIAKTYLEKRDNLKLG